MAMAAVGRRSDVPFLDRTDDLEEIFMEDGGPVRGKPAKPPKRPTIHDLAARLEPRTAPSTVSRAPTKPERVNRETVARLT